MVGEAAISVMRCVDDLSSFCYILPPYHATHSLYNLLYIILRLYQVTYSTSITRTNMYKHCKPNLIFLDGTSISVLHSC